MAFHNKAKPFVVAQYGSHEERMNKLMHKIKRTPENRNTRRQNRRLLNKITGMLQRTPSSIISLNIAEMYYNGTTGIPSDMHKAMEYYVIVWETCGTRFDGQDGAIKIQMINNNMDEVSYVLDTAALQAFAERLHAASERVPVLELKLIATMFSARVADMQCSRKKAIDLYKEAKGLALSVGDRWLATQCSKRKAVLKAVGQTKLDKVTQKYNDRQAKLITNSSLAPHCTSGVIHPPRARVRLISADTQTIENARVKFSEMGFEVGESTPVFVRSCVACGKHDFEKVFKTCSRCYGPRYCSKTCQHANWCEHKHNCR
jgi:hypothetical protein